MLEHSKSPMIALLLAIFSNTAQAFPSCIFQKMGLIPEDINEMHEAPVGFSTYPLFFADLKPKPKKLTDHTSQTSYRMIVFDHECNLIYQKKHIDEMFSIFSLDEIPGIIYTTEMSGLHGYIVNGYLIKKDPKTAQATIKPVIEDIYSNMTPQFISGQAGFNILVCFYGRKCDIYKYDNKKEQYTKKR